MPKPHPQRAVLIFLSNGSSKEMVKLRKDATIIGRSKGDILINDSEVSSTHCQIQEIDGCYNIFDMNSTNGTYVNNQRIVKARLKPGDIITIGDTSIRFTLRDEDQVKHVSTVFKLAQSDLSESSSLIKTMIEGELNNDEGSGIQIAAIYPNGKEEELFFSQKVIYIGRASSFGMFDKDPEISRRHLLIKLSNSGEIFIEDQESTNGSFINGKKIKGMHQVSPTDKVRIGDTFLYIKATNH